MPMKEWLRNIQPVQLYVMLTLTILFYLTELIVSHLTHALILLMDSYHMLCNIFALTGCIITIKYGSHIDNQETGSPKSLSIEELELTSDTPCHDKGIKKTSHARTKQERKLKNTFGWTRIDVITMLICCVFLASFSFSVYVEALQTLAHIDHLDAMHHPISVLCIDEGITDESFTLLDEATIKSIFKRIGPQLIFRKHFNAYTFGKSSDANPKIMADECQTDSLSNASPETVVSQLTNTSSENQYEFEVDESFFKELEEETHNNNNIKTIFKVPEVPASTSKDSTEFNSPMKKIRKDSIFPYGLEKYLSENPEGKLILSCKAKLTGFLRQKLAKVIVAYLVARNLENSNYEIKSEVFRKAAQEIVQLFPTEKEETYYIPFTSNKGGLRQPARGKLWSRYINVKAALRAAEGNRERSPSNREAELDLDNSQYLFLKSAIEPYHKVLEAWELTTDFRTTLHKNSTLENIYNDFPVLKTDLGIQLLELDFNNKNEDKIDVIYAEWPKVALAIINEASERQTRNYEDILGAAGLLLNGVCYLLIGGYTFHQGSFLYVTESGDVILNKIVVNDSVQKGGRRLSRTRHIFSSPPKKRQGLWEMTRDVIGCTLVMICSIIVIFTEPQVAKFIDPIMSLISATCIMTLSYPYIKESCMILLQTMPDTINIDCLKKELINHFPDIVNVHDFHIWQLTASKVISTVHIIFENPKVYQQIMEEVKEFFLENGVTQVTIQPEFSRSSSSLESLTKLPPVCLVACQGEDCKLNHCCPSYEDVSIFKSSSKEVIPTPEHATPTLKSVRYMDDELPSLGNSISSYSLNSIDSNEHRKSNNELGMHVEKNTIKEEEIDDKIGEDKSANSGKDDTSKSSTDDLIPERNERDTVGSFSEIKVTDINTGTTET